MKPTIDMHVRVCMCEYAHTLPGCWLLVEGFKGRIVKGGGGGGPLYIFQGRVANLCVLTTSSL